MSSLAPRLEVSNASMTFGASRALEGVDLRIEPGEVHCLLGQNGSGKSTLVKILSGYQSPDSGIQIRFDGESLRLPLRPATLHSHGIAVVHQDLGLVDGSSVVENICVGTYHRNRVTRRIDRGAEKALAAAALEQLGQQIDLDVPVGRLGVADRVTVAIARALLGRIPGRGLVMFDESTRALPPEELTHFHTLVRRLSTAGESILIVTHNLPEALDLGDRITVLRDGRVAVSRAETAQLTERDLTTMLLGRGLDEIASAAAEAGYAAARRHTDAGDEAPAVRIRARWHHTSGDRTIDIDLLPGEILGVTGRAGSGADELPYLLACADQGRLRRREGSVEIGRERIDLASGTIPDALAAGVALVPESRERQGVAFELSMRDNIALPQISARSKMFHLPSEWQHEATARVIDKLDVRPPDPEAQLRTFSGGNQQKIALGKWLETHPSLLLLHEPTQGVDIGARADIHAALRTLAAAGTSVIYACADASELAMICTRVVVLTDGRVSADIDCSDISIDAILDATYPTESQLPGGDPT